jgi:hypothetical protein
MRPFARLCALLLAAALAACAGAKTSDGRFAAAQPALQSSAETIAEYRLRLNPPPGYCDFDRGRFEDAVMLDLLDRSVEGEAQVLAVWRHCALAVALRGSGGARTTVAVTAALEEGRPFRTPLSRPLLLDLVEAVVKDVTADEARMAEIEADSRRRVEETLGPLAQAMGKPLPKEETRLLGLRARDASAAYIATVSRTQDAGKTVVTGNVAALTQINGLFLMIGFSTPLAGDADIDALVDEAKSVMRWLIADNDHPNRLSL